METSVGPETKMKENVKDSSEVMNSLKAERSMAGCPIETLEVQGSSENTKEPTSNFEHNSSEEISKYPLENSNDGKNINTDAELDISFEKFNISNRVTQKGNEETETNYSSELKDNINDSFTHENLKQMNSKHHPLNLKIDGYVSSNTDIKNSYESIIQPFRVIYPRHVDELIFEGKFGENSELHSKYITHKPLRIIAKRHIDNIKVEGEFMNKSSEIHNKFVPHELSRCVAKKHGSTLKMDGDFNTNFALKERFDSYGLERNIAKHPKDELVLDGKFGESSEIHDKFVPHILKRNIASKQEGSIKTAGIFAGDTEMKNKFPVHEVQRKISNKQMDNFEKYPFDKIPMNSEISDSYTAHDVKRNIRKKRDSTLKLLGNFYATSTIKENYKPHIAVRNIVKPHPSNYLLGNVEPDHFRKVPELGNHFKNHQIKKYVAKRHLANIKSEGNFNEIPEHRDQYKRFFVERNIARNHRPTLVLEGNFGGKSESKKSFDHQTVKKYVATRPKSLIKSEGKFYYTSEFRDKFVLPSIETPNVKNKTVFKTFPYQNNIIVSAS